jgi:hypothetical protein
MSLFVSTTTGGAGRGGWRAALVRCGSQSIPGRGAVDFLQDVVDRPARRRLAFYMFQ